MRVQAVRLTPEVQQRLLKSRIEAQTLKERDILCPVCGYRIQRVYSDATGHLSVKCQKCKSININELYSGLRKNMRSLFITQWSIRNIITHTKCYTGVDCVREKCLLLQ